MPASLPKAVVLLGPTASGKSALALRLHSCFPTEIISADSMQVYRGMDIGTAKPSVAERAVCPHHLIDILDISARFSAADFIAMARPLLDSVTARKCLPLIVGGTGLYADMLFRSASLSADTGSPDLRAQLLAQAEAEGAEALYAELLSVDPKAAAATHPNNLRRVIRYLEIYRATGLTPTEMNARNNAAPPAYEVLFLCLGGPRELLYERIDRRVDAMFEAGLPAEAEALWKRGLEQTPTASQAIGYKEFFPYLAGSGTLDEVRVAIQRASRNYAKRQQTFFARIPALRRDNILDITDCPERQAEERIRTFLAT